MYQYRVRHKCGHEGVYHVIGMYQNWHKSYDKEYDLKQTHNCHDCEDAWLAQKYAGQNVEFKPSKRRTTHEIWEQNQDRKWAIKAAQELKMRQKYTIVMHVNGKPLGIYDVTGYAPKQVFHNLQRNRFTMAWNIAGYEAAGIHPPMIRFDTAEEAELALKRIKLPHGTVLNVEPFEEPR